MSNTYFWMCIRIENESQLLDSGFRGSEVQELNGRVDLMILMIKVDEVIKSRIHHVLGFKI